MLSIGMERHRMSGSLIWRSKYREKILQMNGVNWLLMRNIRIKHAKMRNAFYAMGSCNCVIYSDSSEVVWISTQRISNRSPRIVNL